MLDLDALAAYRFKIFPVGDFGSSSKKQNFPRRLVTRNALFAINVNHLS